MYTTSKRTANCKTETDRSVRRNRISATPRAQRHPSFSDRQNQADMKEGTGEWSNTIHHSNWHPWNIPSKRTGEAGETKSWQERQARHWKDEGGLHTNLTASTNGPITQKPHHDAPHMKQICSSCHYSGNWTHSINSKKKKKQTLDLDIFTGEF